MTEQQPPRPRSVAPPEYANDLDPWGAEQPSGVFHVRTGHTRTLVLWATAIATIATALAPLVQALADRIAPPPTDVALLQELRELRRARDGGAP